MHRLLFIVLFYLCGIRAYAQTCPAVSFRTASQVSLAPNGTIGGLQRLSDGSFTLHSYTKGPIASVTQTAPTPGFQQNFVACSGHTPQSVTQPSGWSFLANPLLGTEPRNPAFGGLLGSGSTVGLCLGVCNSTPTSMQMLVGSPTFNIASGPVYNVSQDATNILTGDFNKDGLGDVVVMNPDTPATVVLYPMQAIGTLGLPSTVFSVAAGGALSATVADFNNDGNLDLAVTSSMTSSIAILLGNGNGSFRTPFIFSTGSQPGNLASADFNGDGKPDLAVLVNGGFAVHFGNGDGSFQGPQTVTTPGFLTNIAAADLNKDGKPDLVLIDTLGSVAQVFLNPGNGAFSSSAAAAYSAGSNANQVFLMDFDWDGNTDIVFGAGHPDGLTPAANSTTVTTLFGNGNGTFNGIPAYVIPSASGSLPAGLAVADFNGDGKLDAVAESGNPGSSAGGLVLLAGHGDGTFTAQTISNSIGGNYVAAADFNHDGKMDLAVSNSTGIWVFLGNGNGTFQSPSTIHTASTGLTGITAGDFNNDGKPDFVVVDTAGGTNATAQVYLGNGDGSFQSPRTVTVGSTPQRVAVADVNGDGKADLVVTNTGTFANPNDPGSVAVLFGNGDGTFQTAMQYPAGSSPEFTLVTDINGDGKPDLVTSATLNFGNSTYGLFVRLNTGNGTFGVAQQLSSAANPLEIGAGDFNGDGKLDLVLSHCCGDTQLGYFLGNGNGTFQAEALVPSQSPAVVRVADFNGDGKPDVLFTQFGPYAAVATNITGATTGGGGGGGQTAITFQTNPGGLQFTVDGGQPQTAPATVNLSQGNHTIAVAANQSTGAGVLDVFANWSDGGAVSHTITVSASPATYTANFTVQYLLNLVAAPVAGGTIATNPGSNGGYFNAGTTVQLTASANAGYQLSTWTGDLNGSGNPQAVTMNGPHNVAASFSSTAGSCSIALGPIVASAPATGTATVETCPNGAGQPNCGVAPEIALSFSVAPGAGCGEWTARSSNPGFLQITSGASGTGVSTVHYALLTNTHNLAQDFSVTVSSGGASATYVVTEAGSGDNPVYRQVYALYEQLLGRDPDSAGFTFWTGSGGAALGQMADSFLTSPEAFNIDFAVMATYQAATGNPPTYAQYASAVAAVRSGAQSIAGLFNSLTGGGYSATNLYQNLLGRAPTAGEISQANGAGLANWFETLIGYPNSTTPVNSPNNEFQSTGTFHTDHSNALYVRMVYYVTLSRDPDAQGLAFWTGVANNGGAGILFQGSAGYGTRIQILGPGTPNQGFIGSPEFQGLFAN